MIHITEDHYCRIAAKLAEAIDGSPDWYNSEIWLEFPDFDCWFRLTAILYWERGMDGSGKPIAEFKDIVPVWWELTTVEEDGQTCNDFCFSDFKMYLTQEL
jgi:hypothetical protein